MSGRVPVRTLVAAADMAARHALAEMDPPPPDLETVLAPIAGDDLRRGQGFGEMIAGVLHGTQCAIGRGWA